MTFRDGKATGATVALTLLILINLFNYIDRYVLAAVISPMTKTFFPEADSGADESIQAKMGSLSTAFMVSYMLIAPLFGFLADRIPRWVLVGIGVTAWSLATGASGLAGTFGMLLFTRCLVGVGEAAYGPVAPTLIADMYPIERRGSKMALFYMAIPVGSALGYVIGGQVTTLMNDWRWAFFVVVPPGLLLGVWCFLMREPPRGQADAATTSRAAGMRDYLTILKTPSYTLNTLGMTAMTFAMGGMAFWMPEYALRRGAGALDEVNNYFGLIVVVSGLGGTIIGGIVGDLLKPKIAGAYFVVSAVAMALAFPLILGALYTPFPLAWGFIFLACFCLFFNTGPTNTILANVTHPSVRASGFALNILIIHALGDAISPAVIGAINDQAGNMNAGFLTVSFLCLVGAVFWMLGARYLDRDTARAPTSLDPVAAPAEAPRGASEPEA